MNKAINKKQIQNWNILKRLDLICYLKMFLDRVDNVKYYTGGNK